MDWTDWYTVLQLHYRFVEKHILGQTVTAIRASGVPQLIYCVHLLQKEKRRRGRRSEIAFDIEDSSCSLSPLLQPGSFGRAKWKTGRLVSPHHHLRMKCSFAAAETQTQRRCHEDSLVGLIKQKRLYVRCHMLEEVAQINLRSNTQRKHFKEFALRSSPGPNKITQRILKTFLKLFFIFLSMISSSDCYVGRLKLFCCHFCFAQLQLSRTVLSVIRPFSVFSCTQRRRGCWSPAILGQRQGTPRTRCQFITGPTNHKITHIPI